MRTIKCNASLLNAKTNQVKRVMWMCTHEFDNTVDFRELQRNFPVCKQNQERNDYIFDARSEFSIYNCMSWSGTLLPSCLEAKCKGYRSSQMEISWNYEAKITGKQINSFHLQLNRSKWINIEVFRITTLNRFGNVPWIFARIQPNLVNSWREQAASHRQCVR